MSKQDEKLLRVGELARAVGKTVRAMHLYEELGLLTPASRTEGGFRMYDLAALERISWIIKLQAIGFTLAEIQGFVAEFEHAATGRDATNRARDVFAAKLDETRDQIRQLQGIERDLHDALAYLDSCTDCSPRFGPSECGSCGHQGHERGHVPGLFAGLSRTGDGTAFDVPVGDLRKSTAPGGAE